MRKVWIIARHEYLVNVRRAGFIAITLMVPVLGIVGLVVAAFFGGQATALLEQQLSQDQQVGVVDEQGDFTPILPAYQDRYFLYGDRDAGRAAVASDELTALLIIPQDYIVSGQVLVVSKDNGIQAASMEDSSSVRSFLVDHMLQGEVPELLRKRVANPINPILVSLEGDDQAEGDVLSVVFSIMMPYFLGMLLIITIFTSANYLLRGVAEEKSSRIIEVILSSVTARELLGGKVVGLGGLGLTQVVVWLLTAIGLSGGAASMLGVMAPLLSRPEVFVLGLVYYLLGFLMYAVGMGAVGSLGTTMRESQQMAGFFSITAMIPLMLGGFMFANPNMPLARILSWFPPTAPTMMMLRLPMTEVPVIDIVGSIVMLLITIPLILWAGAKVFRMGLLMYGNRPSLAQVWRALREA